MRGAILSDNHIIEHICRYQEHKTTIASLCIKTVHFLFGIYLYLVHRQRLLSPESANTHKYIHANKLQRLYGFS